MLIQFSVSNYRSIRDEQVFSLAAGVSARDTGPRLKFDTGVKGVPSILPVAAILGPNASGKSSLIEAFECLQGIVTNSRMRNPDDPIPVEPHIFTSGYIDLPVKFEIIFCFNGVKYEYGIAATKDRIHEEYLSARDMIPGRRNRLVFERLWDNKTENYDWYVSNSVKGKKDAWIKSTHKSASFLATTVQLNSDQLLQPYLWVDGYLRSIDLDTKIYLSPDNFDKHKSSILTFMDAFGFDISDIQVRESEFDAENLPDKFKSAYQALEEILGDSPKRTKIEFEHNTNTENSVKLTIERESTGTQSLFYLAYPIIDTLVNGYCLFIDELNTSLHPHALRNIVKLFSNPKVNRKNAQLVFTTHDTSVLSERLLERDQIWFIERPNNDPSILTPLSDFTPRKEEALQRRYLSGRYGAIPSISSNRLRDFSQSLTAIERQNLAQGV